MAVKVPRSGRLTRKDDEDRFVREARMVAQLHHPGIVPVYEVGRTAEFPYIVAEFVQGISLADMLRARRLGFRASAELIAQLAEALDHTHRQGVVHRDIKPSNIMLESEDGAGSVVIEQGPAASGSPATRGAETSASTVIVRGEVASAISPASAAVRPRIMDFGLARRDEGEITAP